VNETPLLDELNQLRFMNMKWNENDRPVLVADGSIHRIRELDSIVEADRAYVVGVDQRHFGRVCRALRTRAVMFYEMRVDDLSLLDTLGDLTMLAIEWNTKVASLSPLGDLAALERLSLSNTRKATDLSPIGRLDRLRALDFSGGMWTKNTADTLDPIGRLGALEELRLTNLGVLDGGLRPLAKCRALRRLVLSNQFDTADYAYLSVALPDTQCEHFAPYIQLGQRLRGKDVMVVGSRKPFLDSTRDAARLQRHADDFRRLQAAAAADLGVDVPVRTSGAG
jgi:hypothetical protein